MSFWTQALEIARVDLVVERRLGDTSRIVLPFAAAALLIFPVALGLDVGAVSTMGVGIFWAVGVLFGMQIALRQSATDTPERRDVHALLGLDPAARFVGRLISGSVLMAAFLVVLAVATIVLLDPELPSGGELPLVAALLLAAIGLTELGTLAGEVTAGLRSRSALASLLMAPLSLPIVFGASQAVGALTRGIGILPWVLLLLASDLALAVAGVALARPLEEATR